MKKRAVFIDRDGTLIRNRGYICTFSEVEMFSFTAEAVRMINRMGFLAVVITNQSSVARGICTLKQVEKLHQDLNFYLKRNNGCLDAFYFCPFHEKGKVTAYRRKSPDRKPEPGMLLRAARDLHISLGDSYMIGDHLKDIQAGNAAGCRTILVRTGYGRQWEQEVRKLEKPAHRIAANLRQAAKYIGLENP